MKAFDISTLPELNGLPTLSIPQGRLLFDETHSCLGFPLVSKGSIKVFKAFPNGRELLLYHVAAGETCVVSAACLFAGMPYTARAVTQGEVQLRLIPPALFDDVEPLEVARDGLQVERVAESRDHEPPAERRDSADRRSGRAVRRGARWVGRGPAHAAVAAAAGKGQRAEHEKQEASRAPHRSR